MSDNKPSPPASTIRYESGKVDDNRGRPCVECKHYLYAPVFPPHHFCVFPPVPTDIVTGSINPPGARMSRARECGLEGRNFSPKKVKKGLLARMFGCE